MARDSTDRIAVIPNSPTFDPDMVQIKVSDQQMKEINQDMVTTNRCPLTSYEFCAPQYYDFVNPSPGAAISETWFERTHSPIVEKETGTTTGTPQRTSSQDRSLDAPPPTVTQIRKRISDGEGATIQSQSISENPTTQLSPQVISAPKLSSDNIFAQETSSLRHAEKSPSHKRPSYERLFEMRPRDHHQWSRSPEAGKEKVTSNHNSLEQHLGAPLKLGKVRTPDKVKLERLKTAAPLLPIRSTKPLTVPVEFKFSERIKNNREVSFAHPTAPLSKNNNHNMHAENNAPPIKRDIRRVTVPESPMLLTKLRTKSVPSQPVITASESKFDKESSKVSESGFQSKQTKPNITVPIEVKLATSLRLARSRSTCENNNGEQPVSTSHFKMTILHSKTSMEKSAFSRITVPQSPNITKPMIKKKDSPGTPLDVVKFKARPAPKITEPFQPKYSHQHTQPVSPPLPGNVIAEEKRKKFQEALEKERRAAEEAKQFHATPIPDYEQVRLLGNGAPISRPLTKPEPFTLETEQRHNQYQEEFERKLQEEEEELAAIREFHSRPVPHPVPFQPKKSTKPLTQSLPIHLYSDERAHKRQLFDEHLRIKEEELARLQKIQDEERKRREEEEVRQLRKQLIPKARPVMHYHPVIIKPADKKLTIPQSPTLHTNMRASTRKKVDPNE